MKKYVVIEVYEHNYYKRHIMMSFYFVTFMFTVREICFEIDEVDSVCIVLGQRKVTF